MYDLPELMCCGRLVMFTKTNEDTIANARDILEKETVYIGNCSICGGQYHLNGKVAIRGKQPQANANIEHIRKEFEELAQGRKMTTLDYHGSRAGHIFSVSDLTVTPDGGMMTGVVYLYGVMHHIIFIRVNHGNHTLIPVTKEGIVELENLTTFADRRIDGTVQLPAFSGSWIIGIHPTG